MSLRVAIIGAGVIGRFTAWRLAERGASVVLYDRNHETTSGACSLAAAGLLSPLTEAIHAGSAILSSGIEALNLWQSAIERLSPKPESSLHGSWITTLPGDERELADITRRLIVLSDPSVWMHAQAQDLAEIEPTLTGQVKSALFLKNEGYINPEQALPSLLRAALASGVTTKFGIPISQLAAHKLETSHSHESFDWVIDARGLGATDDQSDLRGVRGELIHLKSTEFKLKRPVRILHHRYPLYVVPRGEHHYVIGATQIESTHEEPVNVSSALELLNAAYALHPALRHAHITRLVARARPAYFDNLPKIRHKPGLISLNGMFRHGWLLAPLIAEAAVQIATGEDINTVAKVFVEELA